MEESKAKPLDSSKIPVDSRNFLLREVKTLKGLLQHPQSLYLHQLTQILLVQCDLHLYFISIHNTLKGTKQLVCHFTPSDILSMIRFRSLKSEYVSTSLFRTVCGIPSESPGTQKPSKRAKLEVPEVKSHTSKEYDKMPTFRQCKIKYRRECKFIAAVLLNSGQLMTFRIKFNKSSIATVKPIEGSYLNEVDNVFAREAKPAPQQYPFCYSFDLVRLDREDKGVMLLVAHFNNGIYVFEVARYPKKLRYLHVISQQMPASVCMKCKAVKEKLHIFLGLHNGDLLYSSTSVLLDEPSHVLETVHLPASGTVLYEPIIKIKPISKSNALSVLVCKGKSLIELDVEKKTPSVTKTWDFTADPDSIYGFTEGLGPNTFACSLNGAIYTLNSTKHELELIKEAYGIAKSANGLLLYVLGKGKYEKETKPIIEIVTPVNYKQNVNKIICTILKEYDTRLKKYTEWNCPVDVADIIQLVLDKQCEYREVVNVLIELQEDAKKLWKNLEETKVSEKVKSEFPNWEKPQIQILIAKILYQLLLFHYKVYDSKSPYTSLGEGLELIILKEYTKKILIECKNPSKDERSLRLSLLYCCLAGTTANEDKRLWVEISRIIKNNSPLEITDKCTLCKEDISLFVVKTKSIPMKVGSVFSKEGLKGGKTIACPHKHWNTIIIDQARIKEANETIYECSKCKFTREKYSQCFMCGSYCYKLP